MSCLLIADITKLRNFGIPSLQDSEIPSEEHLIKLRLVYRKLLCGWGWYLLVGLVVVTVKQD
jgi:hypothetical protein